MSIKFSGSAGDDDDNIFTKKKAASGPSKDGLVGETSWLMWNELLKPRDYNMRQETLAYDLMQNNVWFYRDRTGLPRGPCPFYILKQAYIHGIVDENTLIWGNGLGSWVPIRNVRSLGANLSDPFTRFKRWTHRTFIDTQAKIRENRTRLFEEGLAARDTMYEEEARADGQSRNDECLSRYYAKKERMARVAAGEEPEEEEPVRRRGRGRFGSISLSLALPLGDLRPKMAQPEAAAVAQEGPTGVDTA